MRSASAAGIVTSTLTWQPLPAGSMLQVCTMSDSRQDTTTRPVDGSEETVAGYAKSGQRAS